MKSIHVFMTCCLFISNSCKQNHTSTLNKSTQKNELAIIDSIKGNDKPLEENSKYSNKSSLRFLDTFIYSYTNGEEDGEVVLYYDYINKLVLYHPEDEMTDFVIIDKEGEIYLFYTGEHGDKTIQRDRLTFTPDIPDIGYPLSLKLATVQPLNQDLIIDQEKYSRPNISFKGYRLNYLQYNDSLDFYITEQIKINNEQLHAFGQLINLDWNYPLPLGNVTRIISQKQLIGKVTAAGLDITLTDYSYTDFYARIGDYDYFVEDKNGDWVKEQIPLMKYAIK